MLGGSNSGVDPLLGSNSEIMKELGEVIDPELQVPMVSVGLMRVTEKEGYTEILYKPPSIFTPPLLVIAGCIQIYRKLLEKGLVQRCRVRVEHYYLAEEINKRLEHLERILSQ